MISPVPKLWVMTSSQRPGKETQDRISFLVTFHLLQIQKNRLKTCSYKLHPILAVGSSVELQEDV